MINPTITESNPFDKIRNPDKIFKGKKISIIFDSLPVQEEWTSTCLDLSVRTFLMNTMVFLIQRGADVQVTNQDSVTKIMGSKAWEKHNKQEASFSMVSDSELISSDVFAVVGIGLNETTIKELNTLKVPCVVVKTGQNEVFPSLATIISEDPDFAPSRVISSLKKIMDFE